MEVRRFGPVLLVGVLLGLAGMAAEPPPAAHDAETSSEVPALAAFHEVIYPLWHEAWPNGDVGMIRELLPKVREHVRAVSSAELPGILRDRRGKWDAGVAALQQTLQRYEAAAAAGGQPLLDAVEELHSGYEALVRVVRPPLKELDAFHVALYPIVHHLDAERDAPAIRDAAALLVDRCRPLAIATLPKRFVAKQAEARAAFEQLCARSQELRDAAAAPGGPKGLRQAIEAVHDQYRAAARLFE